MFELGAHGRNGKGRSVARQNRLLTHNRFHTFECDLLLLYILHDRFDDDTATSEFAHVVGEADATEQGICFRIRQFALFHTDFQRSLDAFPGFGKSDGKVVAYHYLVSGRSCYLGNSAAHRTRAKYAYSVHKRGLQGYWLQGSRLVGYFAEKLFYGRKLTRKLRTAISKFMIPTRNRKP